MRWLIAGIGIFRTEFSFFLFIFWMMILIPNTIYCVGAFDELVDWLVDDAGGFLFFIGSLDLRASLGHRLLLGGGCCGDRIGEWIDLTHSTAIIDKKSPKPAENQVIETIADKEYALFG